MNQGPIEKTVVVKMDLQLYPSYLKALPPERVVEGDRGWQLEVATALCCRWMALEVFCALS